jgi:hypothetical protein
MSSDYYSYEVSNKVKINLEFAKEPFSNTLALTMYIENPKGVSIKFSSNDFVFKSSAFDKSIVIETDYYDYIKGTENKLSIYNENVSKLSKIVVRTDYVDINDIEVKLPRLSIDDRIEEIPAVRFDKKEGTFWAIINR